jgi:hypothetical protein
VDDDPKDKAEETVVDDDSAAVRDPAVAVDDGFDLLTSPLRRLRFGRISVALGPIGFALALVLSLWVSTMHVKHSLLVQCETQWVAGERLAVRTQIMAARPGPIADTRVRIAVVQDGVRMELSELDGSGTTGGAAGAVVVPPELHVGAAELVLDVDAAGVDPMHERIPIAVVEQRAAIDATAIVAGSTLQYGDDTDEQPSGMRIVVRPAKRLLAGFDNELFVRVTDPEGSSRARAIEVALLDGELMGARGGAETPPILFAGSTDELGLASLVGPLDSEVIRLEVRVLGDAAGAAPLAKRRMRMVSYAGGVDVVAEPDVVAPGAAIEIKAWSLSSKTVIHTDVHGPDGAFMDVLHPPVVGREAPRSWTAPQTARGLVQFEAHQHITSPGESTAFARVLVTDVDARGPESLAPLVAAYRDGVDSPRVERGYDAALERAWIDRVPKLADTPAEIDLARRFLLGTLPAEIWGPPVALTTRERLDGELAVVQGRWKMFMRVFLLGGGGLFLVLLTWFMVRSHRVAAQLTFGELARTYGHDPEVRAEAERLVAEATRAGLLRGLGVIAIMVGTLALTVFILESLVWVY